mmetsp:Transcript_104104/g.299840  ORF Transcript_104104/g.299840 Transcript_104104/m.299840 type:complete len:241 (-) Transcript_104104:46-768(-)
MHWCCVRDRLSPVVTRAALEPDQGPGLVRDDGAVHEKLGCSRARLNLIAEVEKQRFLAIPGLKIAVELQIKPVLVAAYVLDEDARVVVEQRRCAHGGGHVSNGSLLETVAFGFGGICTFRASEAFVGLAFGGFTVRQIDPTVPKPHVVQVRVRRVLVAPVSELHRADRVCGVEVGVLDLLSSIEHLHTGSLAKQIRGGGGRFVANVGPGFGDAQARLPAKERAARIRCQLEHWLHTCGER